MSHIIAHMLIFVKNENIYFSTIFRRTFQILKKIYIRQKKA